MPQHRLHYCDHYAITLPEGHKFPMAKYRMVRDALAAEDLFEFRCAPLATREMILAAHSAEYVDAVLEGTLSAQAVRRIGFPWSKALVKRTLASVGGTLAATEDALTTGFGGNLAGGTHHAFRDEGAGFCVFNDIAVAILHLRWAGRIRKAAIIDCDVHQGDGTAKIFEDDPGVFTLSLHGRNNFPFRKQRSRLDYEFNDGVKDEEYLAALADVLPDVWAFEPDMVFFQSGVDALVTDTLGKLALTHEGLKRRDALVMNAVRERNLPLAITLGGGYSKPIESTVEAHANTFRTAAAVFAS